MKLIVGLGNPGKEYEKTRHNIGFIFLDKFAESLNLSITKEKFNGLYAETIINDEKILLLKPLSYMNLSGEVIIKYVNFYKIKTEDILIINDDLDMEFDFVIKNRGLDDLKKEALAVVRDVENYEGGFDEKN
jgi:PTH1 family peptidyl-tRNA hydrolase